MNSETMDTGGLHYAPCRYGMSRIFFRGPKRRLDSPYVSFIGGTEIFGKFIESPVSTLAEKDLGLPCINLGCVNAGVDAFVNDPSIVGICKDAEMTVVQIMGANFMSNRFYSVHPRRNDRFLRASTVMQAIYNDVDFSDFTFTRHMLQTLYDLSPERFDIVVSELREAWVARMKNLLGQIGPRNVLLWFSRSEMTNDAWETLHNPMQVDPLFVTREMIEELEPLTRNVIEVVPSRVALGQGTKGMYFSPMQAKAAGQMLGVACHAEASEAIVKALRPLLGQMAA